METKIQSFPLHFYVLIFDIFENWKNIYMFDSMIAQIRVYLIALIMKLLPVTQLLCHFLKNCYNSTTKHLRPLVDKAKVCFGAIQFLLIFENYVHIFRCSFTKIKGFYGIHKLKMFPVQKIYYFRQSGFVIEYAKIPIIPGLQKIVRFDSSCCCSEEVNTFYVAYFFLENQCIML